MRGIFNKLCFKEYNLIEVYSSRFWGQPKLDKPKELKGIKQSFSVDFIAKKCACKCFILGNDCYILHRDWFSDFVPSRKEFNEKYPNIKVNESKQRFIYSDGENGAVVLRNEAWLKLPNIIKIINVNNVRGYDIVMLKNEILFQLEKLLNFEEFSLFIHSWENFFEQVIKGIMKHINKDMTEFNQECI